MAKKFNELKKMNGQQELVLLISSVLKEKRVIIWIVVITTLAGITYAQLKQDEYEVNVTMIPKNISSGRFGRFGGLASLAGLNINRGGDVNSISPQHYSYLINSVPFRNGLLEFKVYSESLDSTLTVKDYISEFKERDKLVLVRSYTVGLPGKIISAIRGTDDEIVQSKYTTDTLFVVSPHDSEGISYLRDRIEIKFDQLEGTVQLTTNMPEPTVATQLSLYVQNHLTNELIRIQRDFELKSLDFMEELFKIKRDEFEETQRKLAEFEDSNRNISSAVARSELRKLQSEYDVAFNVYSEVAQQLESKKIDVLNNLPAYSVIKPAVVPRAKVSPRKFFIYVMSVIVGMILGIAFAFSKVLYKSFRKEYLATLKSE